MFLSIFVKKDRINIYKQLASFAGMEDKRKYEVISDQLKLLPFLKINLLEGSVEYQDIAKNIERGREGDEEAKESLYKTGEGYYEKVRTDNSFNHCSKFLTKVEGVEKNKVIEVISGAVVCSLIDYVVKQKKITEEIHHQILEGRLEEYLFYLESPHRE
jgi:hypothetical protein